MSVCNLAFVAGKLDLLVAFAADSGKRKKKGSELEQIDCTPPEHILPGSKDRPLLPLQPQNKDWKVCSVRCEPAIAVNYTNNILTLEIAQTYINDTANNSSSRSLNLIIYSLWGENIKTICLN